MPLNLAASSECHSTRLNESAGKEDEESDMVGRLGRLSEYSDIRTLLVQTTCNQHFVKTGI